VTGVPKYEALGFQLRHGRAAYLLELETLADLPADFMWPARRFTCLLMLDAAGPAAASLLEFAERLIRAGCVYVCAWGNRCEYVHDIFDETLVELDIGGTPFGTVMTTWHADEPLAHTVDFFAVWAQPDDELKADCDAAIAIAVANPAWATEARTLLERHAV